MATEKSLRAEDGPEARSIPVALSSSSVYPLSVHDAFAVARDLGYDGIEVLVTGNAMSQDPPRLRELTPLRPADHGHPRSPCC